MRPVPRWTRPTTPPQGGPTVVVTVSGSGGLEVSHRVAAAAYLWARHRGVPVPDLSLLCSYGPHVVLTFTGPVRKSVLADARDEIAALFNTGGQSSLLSGNHTGAAVQKLQQLS